MSQKYTIQGIDFEEYNLRLLYRIMMVDQQFVSDVSDVDNQPPDFRSTLNYLTDIQFLKKTTQDEQPSTITWSATDTMKDFWSESQNEIEVILGL
jgi:hypothetical protein